MKDLNNADRQNEQPNGNSEKPNENDVQKPDGRIIIYKCLEMTDSKSGRRYSTRFFI